MTSTTEKNPDRIDNKVTGKFSHVFPESEFLEQERHKKNPFQERHFFFRSNDPYLFWKEFGNVLNLLR